MVQAACQMLHRIQEECNIPLDERIKCVPLHLSDTHDVLIDLPLLPFFCPGKYHEFPADMFGEFRILRALAVLATMVPNPSKVTVPIYDLVYPAVLLLLPPPLWRPLVQRIIKANPFGHAWSFLLLQFQDINIFKDPYMPVQQYVANLLQISTAGAPALPKLTWVLYKDAATHSMLFYMQKFYCTPDHPIFCAADNNQAHMAALELYYNLIFNDDTKSGFARVLLCIFMAPDGFQTFFEYGVNQVLGFNKENLARRLPQPLHPFEDQLHHAWESFVTKLRPFFVLDEGLYAPTAEIFWQHAVPLEARLELLEPSLVETPRCNGITAAYSLACVKYDKMVHNPQRRQRGIVYTDDEVIPIQ